MSIQSLRKSIRIRARSELKPRAKQKTRRRLGAGGQQDEARLPPQPSGVCRQPLPVARPMRSAAALHAAPPSVRRRNWRGRVQFREDAP